ncbi:MAG: hypothetical protein JRF07_02640 [Deltaproteobacteria bacterium]|jgi:hypothetical protein|nr:hypothetical protein [Deltaproteobacteria bacterium]
MGKTINTDDVVRAYVSLRDHKNEMKKRHSEELRPLNEKMAKIEGWLQRDLLARGVQSEKTASGTAYLSKVATATVKDRDAWLEFVKEKGMWDLIENRVSKSVVSDYLEETGDIIPGVNYEVTQVVRIRR